MPVTSKVMRRIGLGSLLAGALLVLLWGARVYRTARSLLAHLDAVQAVAESGSLMDVNLEWAGKLVYGVRADVAALKRDVGWAAKISPAFYWVPQAGPLLVDAGPLLDLADALTQLGVLFWDDAALGMTLLNYGIAPVDALLVVQPEMVGKIPEAQALVERASVAYGDIDVAALPWRMRQLALLETALPLADEGLTWVAQIPVLAGADAERTYLVMVLNESELRPGGGFITGVGEVHVRAGRITSMRFVDSYAVDDYTQPYPPAPEAFSRFMNIDLMVFRDSNWSPDFPTAVRQGLELYRPDYPVTVDGVVAVDQYAVQQLIDVIGPLVLPGEDVPLTGATLLDFIYATWSPEDGKFDREWWEARKSIMAPLAGAVLARVESGEIDWLRLVETAQRLLAQKHVLIYFEDADAQAQLEAQGWDGALRSTSGDFLTVVEANVGYNKASTKLLREHIYEVDLAQSPPRALVTLTYTHTSQVDIDCLPESRYDPEYEQMMDRCYWGYLRLYVPEGAQLSSASRHPIPASAVANGQAWDGQARISAAPEGAYTVFEQALLLPTASRTAVQFAYSLPASVVVPAPGEAAENAWHYRLVWQKQAGLPGVPVRVILHLPQNAVLCSSRPRATLDASGVLLYEATLDVDQDFEVCYRLLEE